MLPPFLGYIAHAFSGISSTTAPAAFLPKPIAPAKRASMAKHPHTAKACRQRKKMDEKKKKGESNKKKDAVKPPRGKNAHLAFVIDLANASTAPVRDVRAYLDALGTVLRRNLTETKYARLPSMVSFKMKTLKPHGALTRQIGSQTVFMKARSVEKKRVFGVPIKRLADAL